MASLNTAKPPAALTLDQVCQSLVEIAPLGLAEAWDNVGLLVGNRHNEIRSIMTCLTISPDVVTEAVEGGVDLIVTHHPLPFKPLHRITADTIVGSMLLELIAAKVAVYSAHTAFDSAAAGINQTWAERLGLESVKPLIEPDAGDESGLGSGRCGRLPAPLPLDRLVRLAADSVAATAARRVGAADRPVTKVALACGSGGSFLAAARRQGCDCLITGEATFHTCLEAESSGISLGLLGHYWSERFAMEMLAETLSERLPGVSVWPSQREHDPIAPLGG